MYLSKFKSILRLLFVVIALAFSMAANADTSSFSCVSIDTSKLKMVDARGLNISIKSIRNAALEKSNDFLVVLVFAGNDREYVDLVKGVVKTQHHKDNKEIFVIIYDRPEGFESGMANIFFKGQVSRPVTERADRVGAGLSTLIRRIYYDHYVG